MEKIKIKWNNKDLEIDRLSDGKFRIPDFVKKLDGAYSFNPKPAVEVIIVAMKPLSEKTYVSQALKNKKGITWLDDCRIPYESEDDMEIRDNLYRKENIIDGKRFGGGKYSQPKESGRFPANLLVSDDVLNDGKISKGQQGATKGNEPSTLKKGNVYGDYSGFGKITQPRGDVGSFSRYFDLDKWAVEKGVKDTFPFLIVPKASSSEKNKGLDGFEEKNVRYEDGRARSLEIFSNQYTESSENPMGRGKTPKHRNIHPTVKPIKLMSYLITLGSRAGDIVLDPFVGSGTTCISARILNRKFIGMEISKEYCDIANARLKPYLEQEKLI